MLKYLRIAVTALSLTACVLLIVLGETGAFSIAVPSWFSAAALAVIAVVPWLKWSYRFSLRDLLVTAFLIAVILGLLVTM